MWRAHTRGWRDRGYQKGRPPQRPPGISVLAIWCARTRVVRVHAFMHTHAHTNASLQALTMVFRSAHWFVINTCSGPRKPHTCTLAGRSPARTLAASGTRVLSFF